MNFCVIGLGAMGLGVAKSCARAGIPTYGVDINQTVLDDFAAAGAAGVSLNCAEFAAELDAVQLLVVNAKQVNQILFGADQLASKFRPKTVIMVSSTIAAEDAKSIEAKLAAHDLLMLDAPVSGGSVRANAGEITVMASGQAVAFDKLRPALAAMAAKVYTIGTEIGMGSTVKIIHQLLAGVHIAAGAEAMALAAKANIPLQTMYDVVTNAAGNSWMFENRMQRVVSGDYTPQSAVNIFVKDLNLVNDAAKSLQMPIPLARTALNMFQSASNEGYGFEDDSAVIKTFKGIQLPDKIKNPK